MRTSTPSPVLVALLGAVAVVVFIAGVAAVVNDEDEVPAAGARVQVDGAARRLLEGGEFDELSDGDILRPGDEVVVTEGTAVFELAGGGRVEARAGRGDVDDTRLEIGAPVHLLAGDALASGPAGVAVEAAGTIVTLRASSGDAAARIRRDLAVTTATYRGETAVDSVGQRREVPAYRQLGVSSVGRPESRPEPLVWDASDPWDLRYLGGAIDLTRQLDALARSFTSQSTVRTAASDYESLLPRLADEPAFDASFLDLTRPAGDTLVGAAIAVLGGRGTFAERWEEVFEFHDDGARWGLVALDQGVSEGPVLADVSTALERSTLVPVAEIAVPVIEPAADADADGTAPSTSPTPTTAPAQPTPTTVPEAPPPTVVPQLPLLPPITLPTLPPLTGNPNGPDASGALDGLLQPVEDLLGALIGPSGLLDAG